MLSTAILLGLIYSSAALQQCGRQSWRYFDSENYIVGGSSVEYADSVVSIQVYKSDEWWNDNTWKHTCGGVLLNARWVLTAAHCIKEVRDWGAARVVIGAAKLGDSGGQEISIRKMLEHPEWTPITRTNDVALIELKTNVSFNDVLSPACVSPDLEDVIEDEHCVALGWGKAGESSEFSENLKAVSLNRYNLAYRNMNGVRISREFHICAGRMGERGKGICQGDLGGPLFCRTSASQNVELVAIATNGATCGSPQHPGVFVRVDSFLSWIRRTTDDWSIGVPSEGDSTTETDASTVTTEAETAAEITSDATETDAPTQAAEVDTEAEITRKTTETETSTQTTEAELTTEASGTDVSTQTEISTQGTEAETEITSEATETGTSSLATEAGTEAEVTSEVTGTDASTTATEAETEVEITSESK